MKDELPTKETGFAVALGYVVAALVVLVALSSVLIHHTTQQELWFNHNRVVVDNDACPAALECQAGVTMALGGGLTHCVYMDKQVGSSCSSQCYVTDTSTSCDTSHRCANANVEACLGYCALDNVDVGVYGSILQSNHSDCVGKLKFKEFFSWYTENSSAVSFNWLYQSNRSGDCYAEYGCHWYGSIIRAYEGSLGTFWSPLDGVRMDCNEFLDMTNSECIESRPIQLDANVSDVVFRAVLQPWSITSLERFTFSITACNYWYKCGRVNTTAYTDPAFHDKRALSASPRLSPGAYVTHIQANADDIGKKLAAFQQERAALQK
jgi:hypothetical protein